MTMDSETGDGVLAYMAFRHVEARRREAFEATALRLLADGGTVTADAIAEAMADSWADPDAQYVANIVARKCQSAVEFHEREIAVEREAVGNAEAKLSDARDRVAEAEQALDSARAVADSSPATQRRDDASALLTAAVEAGAEPGAAPGGTNAVARAEVADAVGEALEAGQ